MVDESCAGTELRPKQTKKPRDYSVEVATVLVVLSASLVLSWVFSGGTTAKNRVEGAVVSTGKVVIDGVEVATDHGNGIYSFKDTPYLEEVPNLISKFVTVYDIKNVIPCSSPSSTRQVRLIVEAAKKDL